MLAIDLSQGSEFVSFKGAVITRDSQVIGTEKYFPYSRLQEIATNKNGVILIVFESSEVCIQGLPGEEQKKILHGLLRRELSSVKAEENERNITFIQKGDRNPSDQPRSYGATGVKLISHLASCRVQAFQTSHLIGLFEPGKDAHIKRHPISDQVPEGSGYLVGHG